MKIRKLITTAILGTLFLLSAPTFADVLNGGFESDDSSGGDVAGATSWTGFNGGGFTTSQATSPFEGVNAFKIFGPFNSVPEAAGISQSIAAMEGQFWTASAQVQNWAGDAMLGDTFGAIQLEFYDGGGAQLGATLESAAVNASSTQDVWNLLSISGSAPVGTATAQILLIHSQPTGGNFGGSAFFDAASLTAIPEPGSMAVMGLCALGLVIRRRRS